MAASNKPKSKQTLMRENQCGSATPMMIKNYLRKKFADIAAVEIEERIIQAICGPRTKQEVDVSQRLLKMLTDVTGEHCTLQTPSNGTQRILVFTADQLAVWLINSVDAADKVVLDKRENRLHGIVDEGGKGDGNDEEEDVDEKKVQIIHKNPRPSIIIPQGAGDNEDNFGSAKKPPRKPDSGRKSGQGEGIKSEPSMGQTRPVKKKTNPEGDGSKRKTSGGGEGGDDSRKGVGGRGGGGRSKGDEKKSSQGGKRSGEGSQGRRLSGQVSQGGKGSGEGGQGGKGSGEGGQGRRRSSEGSQGRRSSTGPVPNATIEPGGFGSGRPPPRNISRTSVQSPRPSLTPSSQASPRSNPRPSQDRTTDSRRGSKSEQRPRTASELQRDRISDMISSHISSLVREGSTRQTPRAAALQDVISKKLEGTKMPLDQQSLDAIKDASVLLAAFIDKQAENVELEYGVAPPPNPLAQRGKGPVFSVKPSQSALTVQKITHYDAAQKVAESRGRPKPGAITVTKGQFNPKESKEWARWASDVVNMADKWSQWIDSTVSKAVAAAEKKKAGQDVPGWRDWKATAGQEALEWRRNKKLLSQSAALFQNKMDLTVKPQTAPGQGTTQPTKDPKPD